VQPLGRQLETPALSPPERAKGENSDQAGGGRGNHEALLADSHLARRCLAGEVVAWEELYAQCHPPLLVSIELMLGPGHADPNVVDEIAARVWYTLVENDGNALARYDPQRGGRLTTFLRALAKTEVRRHCRAERRRRNREWRARGGKPPYHSAGDAQAASLLEEFLPTLTRREREFYHDHLLGPPAGGGEDAARARSSSNARQLSHRIRKKLLWFLRRES